VLARTESVTSRDTILLSYCRIDFAWITIICAADDRRNRRCALGASIRGLTGPVWNRTLIMCWYIYLAFSASENNSNTCFDDHYIWNPGYCYVRSLAVRVAKSIQRLRVLTQPEICYFSHSRIQSQSLGGHTETAEREPITGVWGHSSQRDQGAEPWSEIRGELPEAGRLFCIITTRGVGQFVVKSIFCQNKKFVGRLEGHGSHSPLDPQWFLFDFVYRSTCKH